MPENSDHNSGGLKNTSSGISLEIGPDRHKETEWIKCTEKLGYPSGYNKYEYAKESGSPFQLESLLYKEKKLEIILPKSPVSKVITYFKSNSKILFVIHIRTSTNNCYYTSQNTSQSINSDSKFEEFFTKVDEPLEESKELAALLESIDHKRGFNYDFLDYFLKARFWRRDDISFDLSKEVKTGSKYPSEATGVEVTIGFGRGSNEYPNVYHTPPHRPFYIKGLRNTHGQNITVDGGFPKDPLNDFNVYYEKIDTIHPNPLLVVLTIDYPDSEKMHIPGKYFISKNGGKTRWDIRRIAKSINDTYELENMLRNIAENGKLNLQLISETIQKKLVDITANLVIDLEKATQDSGTYTSDGKTIPYEKTISSDYSVISHAPTFTSFTIKRINTQGSTIAESLIPTNRLSKFKVFYNGNITTNPLLIYILHSDHRQQRWLHRHNGDKKWSIFHVGAPRSDTDKKGIKNALEKLKIPNVIIDVSQPINHQYNPENCSTEFNVLSSGSYSQDADYYGFRHTKNPSGPFTIKSVVFGDIILYGIISEYLLSSVTAFYLENDPSLDGLIVIELAIIKGDKKEYTYFNKGEGKWNKIEGQTSQFTEDDLRSRVEALKGVDSQPPSPNNTGAIAGAIVGGVVGAALLGILGWKLTPIAKRYCGNGEFRLHL